MNKVVILKTKVGKFLTDSRIFSENNPPILIGTHIFILNQLHKNTWYIICVANLGVTLQVINFLEHHARSFPFYLSLFGKLESTGML
jgi:hypothetical protein